MMMLMIMMILYGQDDDDDDDYELKSYFGQDLMSSYCGNFTPNSQVSSDFCGIPTQVGDFHSCHYRKNTHEQ